LNKSELKNYREIVRGAEKLAEEIERLRCKAEGRTRPDGMPHGNCSEDRLSGIVAQIVDLSKLLEGKQESLIFRRKQIEDAIDQLNPREQILIRLKYLHSLSWNQVAQELNYSVRQVTRLHGEIIKKMVRDI